MADGSSLGVDSGIIWPFTINPGGSVTPPPPAGPPTKYLYYVDHTVATPTVTSSWINRLTLDGATRIPNFVATPPIPVGSTGIDLNSLNLSPDGQWIYFTFYANTANPGVYPTGTSIGRAKAADGSGVNYTLLSPGTSDTGVALDANYMYWATGIGGIGAGIGRANWDGSSPNPSWLATVSTLGNVDFYYNGYLYVFGGDGVSYYRVNTTTQVVSTMFTAAPSGGMSNGCTDGTYLYIVTGGATLYRMGLDGSAITSITGGLVPGGNVCHGLGVNGGTFYFTNNTGSGVGAAVGRLQSPTGLQQTWVSGLTQTTQMRLQ